MKKRYITVWICLFAAGLSFLCARAQTSQQQLAEKIIRLHVVANSDTDEDQRVKLCVRDAVLQAASCALAQSDNPQAALCEALPTIEQAANECLRTLHSTKKAAVSLRRELFPTRVYETFRLPAGVYRTLRVTIGEGAGHNWWCVVFPALCLPANVEGFEAACKDAGISAREITVMTDDRCDVELEFKTLEWLAKLKKTFLDA